MANSNEDLLRRGYDAFAVGDLQTLREIMDPDVVWHVPGRNPLAGDYRGIDAVLDYFGRSMEHLQGTLRVVPQDVLANDERGVVVQHTTAQRNGRSLDDVGVALFTIRNGKAVEVWQFWADPYTADEVLS